jgi:hypothetical protein
MAIAGNASQPNGIRCGKKKQWKKLDLASGKVIPESKEQSIVAGPNKYR